MHEEVLYAQKDKKAILEAVELDKGRRYGNGLIGAISAGFLFIIVGLIFLRTPSLVTDVWDFFTDFKAVEVPNLENIFLPAPASPQAHASVYLAAGQFSLIWGFFQIAILALRLFFGSPLDKKAQTVLDIVFSLGASYLINMFLNELTTTELWFTFWSTILMLIGTTLIIRGAILAALQERTHEFTQ